MIRGALALLLDFGRVEAAALRYAVSTRQAEPSTPSRARMIYIST